MPHEGQRIKKKFTCLRIRASNFLSDEVGALFVLCALSPIDYIQLIVLLSNLWQDEESE